MLQKCGKLSKQTNKIHNIDNEKLEIISQSSLFDGLPMKPHKL